MLRVLSRCTAMAEPMDLLTSAVGPASRTVVAYGIGVPAPAWLRR